MPLQVNSFLMELWESAIYGMLWGMITSAQSRAARGLLAWNQQDLASKAGVGVVTVHQLEAGTSQPRRATLEVIKRAFERAGVEFIDENGGGPGVRLRKRQQPNLSRQESRSRQAR
jgi:transcriptional regulator with XRE-family HTH domain